MSSPLRSIGLRQRQTATTTKREIGKRTMKTLLAGVAFAIAVAFSSQAYFRTARKSLGMGITTFAVLMRNKALLQAAESGGGMARFGEQTAICRASDNLRQIKNRNK